LPREISRDVVVVRVLLAGEGVEILLEFRDLKADVQHASVLLVRPLAARDVGLVRSAGTKLLLSRILVSDAGTDPDAMRSAQTERLD
jgi:hypothetical protein